jgi:flagellar basal-body rod modification protein FlgD
MSDPISSLRVYDGSRTQASATDPTSVKDLSQNFLHMLTVQLRNQDPMAPMDNAAMTAQLAQLNMVDGINRLNTSMTGMMSQMKTAAMISMSGAVGRMALAPGDSFEFSSQPVRLAAQLPAAVGELELSILDADGAERRRMTLGAHEIGTVDQVWDGKDTAGQMLPAGTYTTVWSAKTAEGRSVFPEAHAPVRVAALNTTHADLEDGRQIGIEQILKWLQA